MLTRLHVKGFKNLLDVDVSFGPFTCIAGANGAGKSNLLDAIAFLGALAQEPLVDAALSVRDPGSKGGDVRSLFFNAGGDFVDEMSFVAEMIIPETATDDLGQPAEASSTFVRYELALRYTQPDTGLSLGGLQVLRENLSHIPAGSAAEHLLFKPEGKWRRQFVRQFVRNKRRGEGFISTTDDSAGRTIIRVHQDGAAGRPRNLLAANLPRTALHVANSVELPTATIVRREMASWRRLQLEPSALRRPDQFTAPRSLGSDGSHLPATLFHRAAARGADSAAVYASVANRVSELIEDVRSVEVDRDDRRELLTLYVRGRDGTRFPARALSDGTLRFLALAVLADDPDWNGVVCMEEPENGIHPARIPAMIRLLGDLAADPEDADVPSLKQVIMNTHSSAVVAQVPEESLLMAEAAETEWRGHTPRALRLKGISDTWRGKAGVAPGKLLAYLNPVAQDEPAGKARNRKSRVIDNQQLRQLLIPFPGNGQ